MAINQNLGGMSNPRDSVAQAGSKIRETGEKVMSEASNRANELREKGDKGIASLGGKMTDLADTIRESAPASGSLGSAAGAVADRLESSGEYLSEHGMGDIAKEFNQVVRRYPIHAMWIGLGFGVLLGSALARK